MATDLWSPNTILCKVERADSVAMWATEKGKLGW